GGQEPLGGLRVLAPDLQREMQEGQIEFQLLLLVSALIGEVSCCLCRTGQRRGAMVYHVVLLPVALLASPALFLPAEFVFVAMRHIDRSPFETRSEPPEARARPVASDTIGECYGSGWCAVKDANVGSACAPSVTAANATAIGSVRRALVGTACGRR